MAHLVSRNMRPPAISDDSSNRIVGISEKLVRRCNVVNTQIFSEME